MSHRRLLLVITLTTTVAAPLLTIEARSDEPKQASPARADRVLAIDVLLIPDATMTKRAIAANAELRKNYPACFTLGPEQVPHITLVHRYVNEKDLPAIEASLTKLAERTSPLRFNLTANEFTYAIWAGVAITTIGIERTRELDDFQQDVVKAIGRDYVKTGTADAFSRSRELPWIDKDIIDYVEKFVPASSGKNYHPHVTIGVAHEDFVKKLKAEPFEKSTFKPAGLAIYQLGNFGTAQKKLWEWKPKQGTKK